MDGRLPSGAPTPGRVGAVAEAAAILGDRARRNVALGPLTTYRVGGPAALLLVAVSDDDLALARHAVSATDIDVLVLGKGSNLLVADRGFCGLVVTLGEAFAGIDVVDGCRVRAGAAVALPVLARRTAAAELGGFEWAVGVPGSLGGAVRMNAGGHGSEMSRHVRRYRFVDLAGGPDGEAGVEALAYGYRRSSVAASHVVVSAELQLRPGDRHDSEARIADIVRWRREHQPGGQNAGSVFTNPEGESAGRLIEAAGLRGFRLGSAQVSPKHANFFQSAEGGSADDVVALMREVARRVEDQTGVRLHPEVRLVGFDAAAQP